MRYILAKHVTNNFNEPTERRYAKYVEDIDARGNIQWTTDFRQAMVIGGRCETEQKMKWLQAMDKVKAFDLTYEKAR